MKNVDQQVGKNDDGGCVLGRAVHPQGYIRTLVPLENPKRSELTRIILRCEFSPPMPTSLLALFVTLRSILRSRVDLQPENLALRHQIGVLQRSVKKRPKLTSMDRLLWVSLSRLWRGWR